MPTLVAGIQQECFIPNDHLGENLSVLFVAYIPAENSAIAAIPQSTENNAILIMNTPSLRSTEKVHHT